MLAAVLSCHSRLEHERAHRVPEPARDQLTVTLTPSSSTYGLDAAAEGAVRFSAEIRNPRDHRVVVAHPTVCWPADRVTIREEDRHGRSEILLGVTRPDGRRITLRDGPHFFDPGGVAHLRIPPKGSQQFTVGWFFRNARGRWENDNDAATLFAARGDYTVEIVLRNVFRCAIEPDKWKLVDVWTGEMRSEPVKITIK
jgi:hypothetical protein